MQRGSNSRSLQELIDSYNAEIMRYSQLAQPAQHTAAEQRAAGERQRESGEEAIERGKTERDYWLARGKQGLQRSSPMGGMPRPRPEPNEPLYRPGSNMPRPEPNEPLERPGEHQLYKHTFQDPHDKGRTAVSASASVHSMTEQEAWMREVEQSLAQLARIVEEIQREHQQITASQNANTPQNAILPPLTGDNQRQNNSAAPQNGANRPMNVSEAPENAQRYQLLGANRHNSVYSAPEYGNQTPQTAIMTQFGGTGTPLDGRRPENQRPDSSTLPQTPDVSNADAPVAPISPEGRTAQSAESIPSDGMGMGYLQVGVYTARQSNPIPNARVTIFRETPEGSELYASALTDDDGKIPLVQLPAGTSSTDAVNAPFTVYSVSVAADGYYPRNELQAQIFSGITAQLWVELAPLPDSAWM